MKIKRIIIGLLVKCLSGIKLVRCWPNFGDFKGGWPNAINRGGGSASCSSSLLPLPLGVPISPLAL